LKATPAKKIGLPVPRTPIRAACLSFHLDVLHPSRLGLDLTSGQGSDSFGFPWILSSGMSLFNGLRALSEQKYFPWLSRGKWAAEALRSEKFRARRGPAELSHTVNVAHILIFCNLLFCQVKITSENQLFAMLYGSHG
jgi:hypothetical protein